MEEDMELFLPLVINAFRSLRGATLRVQDYERSWRKTVDEDGETFRFRQVSKEDGDELRSHYEWLWQSEVDCGAQIQEKRQAADC